MTNRSSWLKYLIPAFLLVTFFAIQAGTADAATKCCACTHPNVTGGRFCIKDYAADCADLAKSTNADLKDANCTEDKSATACKKASNGGICLNEPILEVSFKLKDVPGYKAPEEKKKEEIKTLPLKLNIAIPGLTLYDSFVEGGEVFVPALAQYIQAFQKILIGIGIVAAAIMIMYGGFLYIISGTGIKVREGKKIITDSLIGLVIILGSAVILSNINPNTTNLSALHLMSIEPNQYEPMGDGRWAAGMLGQLGANPRRDLSGMPVPDNEIAPPPPSQSVAFPTYLTIPKDCPGREVKGNWRIGKLSEATIQKFLEYQSKTGVPAGALIANMLTEGTNSCHIQNFWNDPAAACGCKGKKNYCDFYNFGGVGCTVGQMPDGMKCANVAFPPAYERRAPTPKVPAKVIGGYDCDNGKLPPNKNWNNFPGVGIDCAEVCRNYTAETFDCGFSAGGKCYPQISHTTNNSFNPPVAYKTVQCSRVFQNVEDFLNTKVGFIKYCMPYNTSVYDFAYCIGASTYASSPDKGPALAAIIENNCLCGSRDASGCKRNLALEGALVTERIKRNLTNIPGVCIQFKPGTKECLRYINDFQKIVDTVYQATRGELQPRELE